MRQIALCFLLLVATSSYAANQAVIATTDFSSGGLSSLDLSTNTATHDHLSIHSDTALRTYGAHAYVINRLGQDNVIVLHKDDLSQPLVQYSTGNGSNPQDMAFVSENKAYVLLYAKAHVLIVNPATGDSLGIVDLSAFADADGVPEMSQLALYNNRLFVACQRLDQVNGFVPADFSVIAVVDVTTDQVVDVDPNVTGVQGIVMAGKNPSSASQQGQKWILSMVNTFGDLADGGIEVIDLGNLATEGVVMGEAALGGNVNALSMFSDTRGYVVISDANFANLVRGFDLATQTVSSNLSNISGGFIPNLGVFGARLYVLDQGSFGDPTSVGVKIYNVNNDQLVAGPINTGLPPSSIAFLGDGSILQGDFNGDGVVGFPDFLAFAGAFGKVARDQDFDVKFDLNNSGAVDFPDFLIFISLFVTPSF
jgi:hypothetical protein